MSIPLELIDADADKVVRRLVRNGYKAYLVGGCVRDLLLQRQPKDFDVSTSATPREIKQLFRNCRIIGRRFRLAHVFFGPKIIETSTFRANPRADADEDSELLIRRDNVFGSEQEDAHRRDFTMNGLFYDVEEQKVIDHVGGMSDLETHLVRTIGDPNVRFREDPVRMLRAIKFAARLGFTIEEETLAALVRHRKEINKCAAPRVLEEFYRLMRGGAAVRSLELLLGTGAAWELVPELAALFSDEEPDLEEEDPLAAVDGLNDGLSDGLGDGLGDGPGDSDDDTDDAATTLDMILSFDDMSDPEALEQRRALAWRLVGLLDESAAEKRPLSNALVLAVLISSFVIDDLLRPGVRPVEANDRVLELLQPIVAHLHVARRDAERARQILIAQRRMVPSRRRRARPMAMVRRDYFPEALALYELLNKATGGDPDDIERWKRLEREGSRENDDESGDGQRSSRRRRRRRGGRRRRRSRTDDSESSAPNDSAGG